MTCGCGLAYQDHGDSANLTKDRFAAAGKTKAAGGKTVGGAVHAALRTHRKRK
jgi:hypothetical protein